MKQGHTLRVQLLGTRSWQRGEAGVQACVVHFLLGGGQSHIQAQGGLRIPPEAYTALYVRDVTHKRDVVLEKPGRGMNHVELLDYVERSMRWGEHVTRRFNGTFPSQNHG